MLNLSYNELLFSFSRKLKSRCISESSHVIKGYIRVTNSPACVGLMWRCLQRRDSSGAGRPAVATWEKRCGTEGPRSRPARWGREQRVARDGVG